MDRQFGSDSFDTSSFSLPPGEQFHLTGPPRRVPMSVRCRVLFGGFLNQMGWALFGFGMIFVWAFLPASDFASMVYFRGHLITAQGKITKCEKTSFSVGGGEHTDGTPVYANYYRFTHDGQDIKGVSYGTGMQRRPGTTVTIEISPGNLNRSRIQGMRTQPVGPWVAFVLLFPMIGLVMMGIGLRHGFKATRLLTQGLVGRGRLIDKKATNTSFNDQRVYQFTFEFEDTDGYTHRATAKTHHLSMLEDEAEEPLLYAPADPSYAVLLDILPGSPRIDEQGQIQSPSGLLGSLLVLVIPMVTLVGNGLYIMWRY
jgi:hypothetical protein